MLWYPRGQRYREVVSARDLSREYQEAMRLLQNCTQYQWGEDSGVGLGTGHVTVTDESQKVTLGGTNDKTQGVGEFDLGKPA